MKKIVALVLSLVMVLGLATTAFGAADTYDSYRTDAQTIVAGKLVAGAQPAFTVTIEKVAAQANSDGSGNLEYYTVNGSNYYLKTTEPTVVDYAITAHGKTDILFYLTQVTAADVEYVAEAALFTNFGQSCGQLYQVNKENVYYSVTKASAGAGVAKFGVYVEDADNGTVSVLAGNEIVKLNATAVDATNTALTVDEILAHNWAVVGVKATTAGTEPTEVKCLNCGASVTKFYDAATKVPAGSVPTQVPGYNYWFVAPLAGATTTPAVDGDKVESAETFDAGIAMYVGMSVMAAAGSAVVLKKKD